MGTLTSFILMIFHLYGLSNLVLSFTFGHFVLLVLVLLKIFSSFSPFTVSVKFKKGDQVFTYLILRASHPQILYIYMPVWCGVHTTERTATRLARYDAEQQDSL